MPSVMQLPLLIQAWVQHDVYVSLNEHWAVAFVGSTVSFSLATFWLSCLLPRCRRISCPHMNSSHLTIGNRAGNQVPYFVIWTVYAFGNKQCQKPDLFLIQFLPGVQREKTMKHKARDKKNKLDESFFNEMLPTFTLENIWICLGVF